MQPSKVKTLMIYQILDNFSDDEHPLSTTDLIDMLAQRGIKSERKSIYSDIKTLNSLGFDIMTAMTPKRGYFMANRKFELPEVMLLIDAVTSAGFITPKKTQILVEKLKTLVSDEQAKSMISQVYVDTNASKCDNEEIYIVINQLHEAIMKKKKVKFIYRRRSIDVKNKKRNTDKSFFVSPYALLWKNDHYYLACNNQKYDNLMNLRVDRIKKISIVSADARPISEVSSYKDEFDIADYSSKMFNMFSGEDAKITLRCSLKLQEEMLDRFGKSIPLTAADSSHFDTTVNAAISDGLVSWIMQYGSDIKVLNPPELIEMIKTKANDILNSY